MWTWEKGCVYFSLDNCDICGFYISPNTSIDECMKCVDIVANRIWAKQGEVIIAGDINARSLHCGYPFSDDRGYSWVEWAETQNLVVYHTGMKRVLQKRHREAAVS